MAVYTHRVLEVSPLIDNSIEHPPTRLTISFIYLLRITNGEYIIYKVDIHLILGSIEDINLKIKKKIIPTAKKGTKLLQSANQI